MTPMLLALVLAMTGAAEPIAAKKGILHLADAVESSTFICIGSVAEVRSTFIPPDESEDESVYGATPTQAPLGVIRVERVLKGDARATVVHHEAWPTWTCDTTDAAYGRRAIFFLAPGRIAARPAAQRDAIYSSFGSSAIYRNVGSGDGIVPIRVESDGPRVEFGGAPKSLRSRREPTIPPRTTSTYGDHSMPLAPIVGYIEDLCRFDPAALAIHARAFEPARSGEHPFDLRILPNGDARLAIDSRYDEVVRTFTLEPAAWNDLSMELMRLAQDRYVDAGENADRLRRSLRVSVAHRAIRFLDPGNLDTGLLSPAQRDSFRTAVQAWTLVRAAIDCPECADHRAADKDWLGR